MNFKLTNIDAINQMYGKKMAKMNETTWHDKFFEGLIVSDFSLNSKL